MQLASSVVTYMVVYSARKRGCSLLQLTDETMAFAADTIFPTTASYHRGFKSGTAMVRRGICPVRLKVKLPATIEVFATYVTLW